MRKWILEDWAFEITTVSAGPEGNPEGYCRMGFEPGDRFSCMYDCPVGFCPKTMGKLHALCDAVRAGGDLRLLGGQAPHTIRFTCADGPVCFELSARHIG